MLNLSNDLKKSHPIRIKLSKGINQLRNIAFKRVNDRFAIIIAIIALLLVALAFFSVFILFPYQKQKSLVDCLFEARKVYFEQWMTTCRSLFSPQIFEQYGYEYPCRKMPLEYADPITQKYYNQIDACLAHYIQHPGQNTP